MSTAATGMSTTTAARPHSAAAAGMSTAATATRWCSMSTTTATRWCSMSAAASSHAATSPHPTASSHSAAGPHSTAATGKAAVIGSITAAAAIVSSAPFTEAMPAPAVAITPAGPGAHAQEDAVVEVARPVKSHGRAGVGRVVVVSIGTNRWYAQVDADGNLRVSRWRQGQTREQRCC